MLNKLTLSTIIFTSFGIGQTTIDIPALGDAMVHEGFPNVVFGTDPEGYRYLALGYDTDGDFIEGTAGPVRRMTSFVQFDLSNIPNGANVTEARLILDNQGGTVGSGVPRGFDFACSVVAGSWNENSLTWNNKPNSGTEVVTGYHPDNWPDLDIDITGIVLNWIGGTYPNYGLEITKTSNWNANIEVYFNTKERLSGAYAPKLRVTYSVLNPEDLDLQNIEVVSSGPFSPGDEIDISNRTENIGGVTSPGYRITFFASDDSNITSSDHSLGYIDRAGLPPGGVHNYTTTANFPGTIPDGNYYIGAILTVSDGNASNNVNYDSTTVQVSGWSSPNPEFVLASLPEDPLVVGEALIIEARYYHEGGVSQIAQCTLMFTHPSFQSIGVGYDFSNGYRYQWADSVNYIHPPGVQVIEETANSITLRWSVLVKATWPICESGIDLAIRTNDTNNNESPWVYSGLNLGNNLPEYGTTIITHGFSLSGHHPIWTTAMGNAIGRRLGNAQVLKLNPQTGIFDTVQDGTIINGEPSNGSLPIEHEKIFIMDWASESNQVSLGGWGKSEAASRAFVASVVRYQMENPGFFFLGNIHFIGHSRGTVVTSEMVEYLSSARFSGENFGFQSWVGQNIHCTLIDPHPVIDHPAPTLDVDWVNQSTNVLDQVRVWNNMTWNGQKSCYTIFQPNSFPAGLSSFGGLNVKSAVNRDLDQSLPGNVDFDHTQVHTWYYATIDPSATEDELLSIQEEPNYKDTRTVVGDRHDWFWDGMGISAGFSQEPTGGELPHDFNLSGYWEDSTPVLNPEYSFYENTFFNGDFRYSSGVSIGPGWSNQGGGGSGHVSTIGGNNYLELDFANTWRRHDFFYLPETSTHLVFDLSVDNPSSSVLTVHFNEEAPFESISLLGSGGPWHITSEIPQINLGKVNTITFEISSGVGTQIRIDNIRFLNTQASFDNVGIFRPSNNNFYLDTNGDGHFSSAAGDDRYWMGSNGDLPIVGDWNGDGFDEIGVFRPSNNNFYLDTNGDGHFSSTSGDDRYWMGAVGDLPIIGDWNGDGVDEIGIFRPSNNNFYLDTNGDGHFSSAAGDDRYWMGAVGDLPIIGDWNGDGLDEIGIFRPSNNNFYLDTNGDGHFSSASGDDRYWMGAVGDLPIIGDWNGDGMDEIGIFRPSNNNFYLDTNGDGHFSSASGDDRYWMGASGDLPLSGKW